MSEQPSSIVLRVAQAIIDAQNIDNYDHIKMARAAIEAMREPTAEMLSAMEPWTKVSGHPELIWKAGIIEALAVKK